MTTVYVKLMGSLLPRAPQHESGQVTTSVKEGSTVGEAIQALGIPWDRVKLVLVNHTPVPMNYSLQEGDKVSLFPPEYPVFADWEGFIKKEE